MRRMELLRLVWRRGTRVERSVAFLVAFAPFFAGLLFLIFLAVVVSSAVSQHEALYSALALVFASGGWAFYSPAIVRPMDSSRVIRALLEAESLPDAERSFLQEVARYKDECGIQGQIPGDVARSYLYSLIYYSACVTSLVSSIGFYGTFGPLAPAAFLVADAAISTTCLTLYLRRRRKELERSERLGFRMVVLRKALSRWAP